MSAKKCPSCGKERCPGIVMRLDCPKAVERLASIAKEPQVFKELVAAFRGGVTKPVTKVNVTKPRIIPIGQVLLQWGNNVRPHLGDKSMTPAERQRKHRKGATP